MMTLKFILLYKAKKRILFLVFIKRLKLHIFPFLNILLLIHFKQMLTHKDKVQIYPMKYIK